MFRKTLDEARAGDNVGLLLRGVSRDDVRRGQVVAAPGSIHPHTKFVGQVYVLTKRKAAVTTVLLRLSSPVLFPYDWRHRFARTA